MVSITKLNISFLSLCVVVLSVLPTYLISDQISILTDWLQFPLTTATALVNVFDCLTGIFGFIGITVTNSYLARYRTILISSLLYMIGLILIIVPWWFPDIKTVRSYVLSGLYLTGIGRFSLIDSAYALCEERGHNFLNALDFVTRIIVVVFSIRFAKVENFNYNLFRCSIFAMAFIMAMSLFYLVGYIRKRQTELGRSGAQNPPMESGRLSAENSPMESEHSSVENPPTEHRHTDLEKPGQLDVKNSTTEWRSSDGENISTEPEYEFFRWLGSGYWRFSGVKLTQLVASCVGLRRSFFSKIFSVQEGTANVIPLAKLRSSDVETPSTETEHPEVNNYTLEPDSPRAEDPSTGLVNPAQVGLQGKHSHRLLKVIICATFLAYGMIKSMGNTFFFWQGIQMDSTIKNAEIPLQTFLLVNDAVSLGMRYLYEAAVTPKKSRAANKKCAPAIEYGVGMLMGLVCCMVASWLAMDIFENIIGKKPKIGILWLTPQFVFLGAMDGLAYEGIKKFIYHELPGSKKSYAWACTEFMFGVGSLFAAILVQVIKVSTNWLSDEKQEGGFRLDNVFHVMPLVAIVFLVIFVVVAFRYYSQDKDEFPVGCNENNENEEVLEHLVDVTEEVDADHIQNNQPEGGYEERILLYALEVVSYFLSLIK